MKAQVDQEACIGCGACVDICPDVFKMEDDTVTASVQELSEESVKSVKEAQDTCPVDAIAVR
jgi:ferredoxin